MNQFVWASKLAWDQPYMKAYFAEPAGTTENRVATLLFETLKPVTIILSYTI